jgi:hypothetical protein
VSGQKIYDLAIDKGRRIEAWEERRRERVFGEAKSIGEKPEKIPKVLYIQVGATGVNDRSSKEWMECKVVQALVEGRKCRKIDSGLWIRRRMHL